MDTVYVILIVVAAVALCVIFLVIVMLLVRKAKRKENKKTKERSDINPIYGLYHRGWDGEGDYGDGDQQEVTDNNELYGT
jgi:uncharacterized membrane protein